MEDDHSWRPEDLGTVWSPTVEDRIRAGLLSEARRDEQCTGKHRADSPPPEVWYS